MPLGFSFRQTMSGSYWLLGEPTDEREITLSIEAATSDVRAFARHKSWRTTGKVDAERLASSQPLEGTLALQLLKGRRIACRFEFSGDDGRHYDISGLEEWSRMAPIESLTLLPVSLYDERGEEIGRGTLRFDLRSDWARWLKSFRLRWAW